MSTELIKVTINGDDFQVPKGSRLIEVCREKGFDIPSFCYYSDLALQASCRMCLVRIEKMPKLQTSCTIICTDGMAVTTRSEEIEKAQRAMVEFLLANHPLDCPVCDRGGECELQEMAFDWGGLEERFFEPKNAVAEKYLSPMVANDPQRCILCKRCTRVCDEWMGEDAIEAGGRGANTVIGTYGGWLNCSQCGNCIEVCPTGTLLDASYRHQARPWELAQTVSTCTYCSDGCAMSLGSRAGELMRIVARDRYVNGHNGEFLCVKGRFGHPFVNHEARLRTPMIRYKKGGRLVPATWDQALKFAAEKLDAVAEAHGPSSIAVIASPRTTNESIYALRKFAREIVGTESYAATDAFSLQPFFNDLGGTLSTHRDIRHAKTILIIGGEPEELQPFTGKQVRQAVRNGEANLLIVNSVPIRLKERATRFLHIAPGSEDAVVLALSGQGHDLLAARKMGVEEKDVAALRRVITDTEGDIVIMFGGELSAAAQSVVAQMPYYLGTESRRVLLHPLPLFNNSIGAHDMGMMSGGRNVVQLIEAAGDDIRAMYVSGSFMREQLSGRAEMLDKLDLLIVQELFETGTTKFADVVFPATSFAESDGTFTNNDGLVQRVRASIPPLHQSRPDWMITAQLARALGVEIGFEMSPSGIFKEISEKVSSYSGIRYPQLKDESKPVQVSYPIAERRNLDSELETIVNAVDQLEEGTEKIQGTPPIGHELFRIGTLTDKVPQFHLLAAGNPEPDSLAVSPLYQITVDSEMRRQQLVSGD